MAPKPLFPTKVTTIAPDQKTENNGPKPLFSSPAKETQSVGPKPLFTKGTSEPTRAVVPKKSISEPGKVLFTDRAVSATVVDPFYRSHPLCANLSNKDVGRVRNLVDSANLNHPAFVIDYGEEQRDRFSKLVSDIVNEQTSGKTSDINRQIQMLLAIMDDSKRLVQTIRNPPVRGSFFTRWATGDRIIPTVSSVLNEFQGYLARIDLIVKELQSGVSTLVSHINSFDSVFKSNQDNFTLLRLHVIAGRIIVHKYETEIIPAKMKKLDKSNMFEVQDLVYFKDSLERFIQKVNDLDSLAHSVLLNAPAIRTMQMASKDKADRIQRVAHTLVPIWKQETAVLVGVLQNTQAKDLVKIQEDTYFKREVNILAHIEHSIGDFKKTLV